MVHALPLQTSNESGEEPVQTSLNWSGLSYMGQINWSNMVRFSFLGIWWHSKTSLSLGFCLSEAKNRTEPNLQTLEVREATPVIPSSDEDEDEDHEDGNPEAANNHW